jgi:N-hydroxyarylamine O-acetyltransferase
MKSYFERISFRVPEVPSLENLKNLHRTHVLHVPFENLDIHYPQKIILDTDRFYDKIVRRQRGGFCYEQNGLLYEVLQQLGYRAWLISASVYQVDEEDFGPPAAHVAMIAEVEGQKWLIDVGFGSSFPEPLLLVKTQPQEQDGITYVIKTEDEQNFVLDRSFDGGQNFTPMYQFDLEPRKLNFFSRMCDFHQTSEASPLYRKKLISIARPGGRITLTSDKLIVTRDGDRRETDILDEADFREKLRKHFGFRIVEGKVKSDLLRTKTNPQS